MITESLQFDFIQLHPCALKRKEKEEWVRQVASKYEIDISKYFLGSVLVTIVGDDANCFGLSIVPFDAHMAQRDKEDLIIRMNWEINLPETPDNIRDKLEEFLPEIIQTDWENEDDFFKIKNVWHEEIESFVLEEISNNDEYMEAMMYKIEVMGLFSSEEKQYLGN